MAKSFKLEDEIYLDSGSVAKGEKDLNTYFSEIFKTETYSTGKFSVTAGTNKRGSLPVTIPNGYKIFSVGLSDYYNYCDENFVQFSFDIYKKTIYWYITPNYAASDECIYFKVIYIKEELI